jgi:hypothetical protein
MPIVLKDPPGFGQPLLLHNHILFELLSLLFFGDDGLLGVEDFARVPDKVSRGLLVGEGARGLLRLVDEQVTEAIAGLVGGIFFT